MKYARAYESSGLGSYGSDSEEESLPIRPQKLIHVTDGKVGEASSEASTSKDRTNTEAGAASVNMKPNSPLAGLKFSNPTPSRENISQGEPERRKQESSSPPSFAAPLDNSDIHYDSQEIGPHKANGMQATPLNIKLDSLEEFGIPKLELGVPKASVAAKLANFHHLATTRGLHFNDSLAASKAFRNPRIYAKLVDFVDVDETGSNWDRQIWDPHRLGPQASASRIAELQRSRAEEVSAQPPGSRTSIAFTSSAGQAKDSHSRSRAHEQARVRESMARKETHREKPREHDKERTRSRESSSKKKSRWDTVDHRRHRSRSPR